MRRFNLLFCAGLENMDHNLFHERSYEDVLMCRCHCQAWRAQTNPEVVCATRLMVCVCVCVASVDISTSRHGWWAYVTTPMHACACMCVCVCLALAVFSWRNVNDHGRAWAADATPPMYPSPEIGQTHEQKMKSLNLVVGNGIRKHWPFVASLRPQCESHDSRIFTVPPVTGPVKSQHTSLQHSRP